MTTTTTKSDRTKARIVDAARSLFLEHGVDAVSIRDIAAAAGITHALVHRYFGSRDQLIASIVRRELEVTANALQGALAQEDPFTALRETILYGFGPGRGFLQVTALVRQAGLSLEDVVPPTPVRPYEQLVTRLAALRPADARDARPDPAITMLVIAAATFALDADTSWLLGGVGLDPRSLDARREEIVDELVRIAASAFGPARGA